MGDADLLAPLQLVLDPAQYFTGLPQGTFATTSDGLWLIDLSSGLTNGRLVPGETTTVRTITLTAPGGQRASVGHGVFAVPYPNTPPVIDSAPVTSATLDPQTRVVSWTPHLFQAGEHVVELSVTDGHQIASESVTLTAAHANQAPAAHYTAIMAREPCPHSVGRTQNGLPSSHLLCVSRTLSPSRIR